MLPLVLLTFALVACSSDGGGASLAALGIDDGASEGLSGSASVTGEKTIRITLATGALVEIPAGAVTKTVKVAVERPADGKALNLVNRLPKAADRIASAPYVLTPHGTKFQEDVTVKLPLSKSGARKVSVAWLEDENDKQWKVLSVAEIEGEKAAFKLKHFSVLMLLEDTSDLVPLDAGAADEDASETADAGDPGGEEAGSPDDTDAETMSPLDAGGDELDAETVLDGSEPMDADDRNDAGAPDGATGDASVAPPLLARLTECGLVSRQGSLPEPTLQGPLERCHYRCLLAGPCSDIQGFYCYGGDVAYTTQTQACFRSCDPSYFVCPDQTQGYFQCDGYLDCVNGEDEASCDPPYFQCGSQRLPAYVRCNGAVECRDGEDEQGCVWHVCDEQVSFPPDYVCDGYSDCVDGSDEPASCATVACAAPPVDAL